MKKILKAFSITLLCCLILNSTFAQKGYIINLKNDTIKCIIKEPFMGGVKYKLSEHDKAKKITTDSIKEYCKEDSVGHFSNYLAKTVRYNFNNYKFIKRFIYGEINLYVDFIGSGNYTSVFWYASKGTDSLKEIKSNSTLGSREERKKNFYELIADNAELSKKYKEDKKFTFDELEATIKEYNRQYAIAHKH